MVVVTSIFLLENLATPPRHRSASHSLEKSKVVSIFLASAP